MNEDQYQALSSEGQCLWNLLSQLPIEKARKMFHKNIHQKRHKIKMGFMVEGEGSLITVGHKYKHIHNH